MRAAGARKIFADSVDTAALERPGFKEMLAYVHTGDQIVIMSLLELGDGNADVSAALNAVCSRSAALNVLNLPSFASVHDASERWQLTCLLRDVTEFASLRESHPHAGFGLSSERHGERGRKREYAPDSPNPVKRGIYHDVLRMLTESLPVTQIARTVGINRKQIYRIKEYAQENGDLVSSFAIRKRA